jgi:hypothetical protein
MGVVALGVKMPNRRSASKAGMVAEGAANAAGSPTTVDRNAAGAGLGPANQ